MDPSDTYQIIILLILLALSAFFSSNETALMSVNRIRLRSLCRRGQQNVHPWLLTFWKIRCQNFSVRFSSENNIVNIFGFLPCKQHLHTVFGGYMVSIVTLILTVLILIFGEITPKKLRNHKRGKDHSPLYPDF